MRENDSAAADDGDEEEADELFELDGYKDLLMAQGSETGNT